jgi:hypothetical protein
MSQTEIARNGSLLHRVFAPFSNTGLLVGFVFCRRQDADVRVATAVASVYFLTMGACGYAMHKGFIASDVIVASCGLFFVIVYPRLSATMRGRLHAGDACGRPQEGSESH